MSDSRKLPTDAAASAAADVAEAEICGRMRSSGGVIDGPRMEVTKVARPAGPVVGNSRPIGRPAYDRIPPASEATCHVTLFTVRHRASLI